MKTKLKTNNNRIKKIFRDLNVTPEILNDLNLYNGATTERGS
jgi:hypothetical protein